MKTGNFIPETVSQSLNQQTKTICLYVKSCEFYVEEKNKTFVMYCVAPVICLSVFFSSCKNIKSKKPKVKLYIFSFRENFGGENVNFFSEHGRLNDEQAEKHNVIHMKDFHSFYHIF